MLGETDSVMGGPTIKTSCIPFEVATLSLAAFILSQIDHPSASAKDVPPSAQTEPAIKANRWEEDWSPFLDPNLRTSTPNGLKYVPLFADNPDSYVSIGLNVRENFEVSDAPAFGTSPSNPQDSYWLQRAQFHIDAHLNENWQLFTQFEDVRAFDKIAVGSTDANQLDLRLAFMGYTTTSDAGTFSARIGRQDFAFDLECFLSSRDGPNVRQSFDSIWAGWETDAWRFYGLVSQPVDYQNNLPFDDESSSGTRFSATRVERQLTNIELSAYYGLYQRTAAYFTSASGEEDRHIFDARSTGTGSANIQAWAFGARTGYTFSDAAWSPRLGLQFDLASGDRNPRDGAIGTFDPLFPNGFYFSLGGHTGYTNVVHLKLSITIQPIDDLTVMAGTGLLWRQTMEDAVYTLPSVPVADTAGFGTSWTRAYAQLRVDYSFNPNLTRSIEAVHYQVGSSLRAARARDSDYVRAELNLAW
jgi:hypothetical protein